MLELTTGRNLGQSYYSTFTNFDIMTSEPLAEYSVHVRTIYLTSHTAKIVRHKALKQTWAPRL